MIVTADMMRRMLESFGAGGKPTARVLIWMADKTVSGDRLGAVEYEWLKTWLDLHGARDPRSAFVVQVANSTLAEAVFNGHTQSARNALRSLIEDGVLTLVRKGQKGHGSLYLLGYDKGKESRHNLPLSGESLGQESRAFGQEMRECGQTGAPVTCENANAFIPQSSFNRDRAESALEDKKCPTCGSSDIEAQYGALHYCRACRTDFVILSGKPKKPAHDSRAA